MKRRGSVPVRIIAIIAVLAVCFWYFGETRQTNAYIEECDAILLVARRDAQNHWLASAKKTIWQRAARECCDLSPPINANREYVEQSRRFFNAFYEQVDDLPGTGDSLLAAAAGFAAGYSDARNGTNYTPQVMNGLNQAQVGASDQMKSIDDLIHWYQAYTRKKGYHSYQAF